MARYLDGESVDDVEQEHAGKQLVAALCKAGPEAAPLDALTQRRDDLEGYV